MGFILEFFIMSLTVTFCILLIVSKICDCIEHCCDSKNVAKYLKKDLPADKYDKSNEKSDKN